MNVACTACPAKYAVPDDKVRGKRARITCKHCNTPIIVDGTRLGPPAASSAPQAPAEPKPNAAARLASTRITSPASHPAQSSHAKLEATPKPEESSFIVAVHADRQEPASLARLVDLYASRTISAETYVWREGMPEWKTPFEIPVVAAALRARGLAPRATEPGQYEEEERTRVGVSLAADRAAGGGPRRQRSLPSLTEEAEDEGVTIAREPISSSRPAASRPRSEPAQPSARTTLHGAASAAQRRSPSVRPAESQQPKRTARTTRVGLGSPMAAARSEAPARVRRSLTPKPGAGDSTRAARRSGHPERALDELFGKTASVGSEADPTLGLRSPTEDAQRRTGARNDSSVLFSLDALVKKEKAATPKPELDDAELLLGTAGSPGAQPSVNPAASLGAALSAPDFTAPVRVESSPPSAVFPAPLPTMGATALAVDSPIHAHAQSEMSFDTPKRRKRWVVGALLTAGLAGAAAVAFGIPQRLFSAPPEPKAVSPVTAPATATVAPTPAPAEPAAQPITEAPPQPLPVEAAPPPVKPARPVEAAPKKPSAPAPRSAARPPAMTAVEPAASEPEEAPQPGPARAPTLTEVLTAEARGETAKNEPVAATGEDTPAPSEAPPFDRAAAAEALGAAAGNVTSCKMLGGPTGAGQATVVFSPTGRVSSASVNGEFGSSSVGNCIAKIFRSARVPAFSGDPVTVSKRFAID